MSNIESAVTRHYGEAGLLQRILMGLNALGVDRDNVQPADLSPVDEFHLGGRAATAYALSRLDLSPGQRILDIGCGIGGAARFLASESGCTVDGIDLTPEYISAARTLTDMTGLNKRVRFEVANALAMPFDDATFDAAVTFHVAMNIHDRAGLYAEMARVLKPGAMLCIYDVMKTGDGDLAFPVPWANTADTSHLTSPDEMLSLLGVAGFEVNEVEDRTDIALEFLQKGISAAKDGPPPLGIHILLGAYAPQKIRNALENIQSGCVAPVQMIARKNTQTNIE